MRVVVGRVVEIARDHEELPELLFERHAPEQILDPSVDGQSGVEVRRRFGRLRRASGDCAYREQDHRQASSHEAGVYYRLVMRNPTSVNRTRKRSVGKASMRRS